mmetsp:Transcript_8821/g.11862  ORF Transcript_8821/g.11862 Transcript_8821/m.11862 type:complete len:105 (-) Transcript_8821:154-468(-)|eukprot:CAMPEP_0201478502 /NCGR_PEP_ID=MMETSP0151_2-20130828/3313_1 /ASSEMBLY_ACC=CAM_ASM_000257 /TAXON_ID=200890 /ORGANISM="Paramoeba atlantica, Strain 621/1 / CCAP 1560/9" /LENGTH=104 /DNA_ID=CAMNT_0047859585 /DNA_START=39 /DNA_END=353 /DNA_ORIENTATION=+
MSFALSQMFRRLAPANEAAARIFGNRLHGADGKKSAHGLIINDTRIPKARLEWYDPLHEEGRLRKIVPSYLHEKEFNAFIKKERRAERGLFPPKKGEGKRSKKR